MSVHTILTGDRPTGPLHLGHYVGSLKSRIELQHLHKQFILISDSQALTDNMGTPQKVSEKVYEVLLDYLAAGIDPSLSTIFVQSQIPELSELSMLLMNLVTVSRLERNPTIRHEIQLRGFERGIPAGFLTYPVAQAADITAFGATLVPVGEDQKPMIEQTNELVHKFNTLVKKEVLLPCSILLSETPRLPGIDGKAKMSKSLGNAIALGASSKEIAKAVHMMYTDPTHIRVEDPGNVAGNVVFAFLDAFDNAPDEIAELKSHYQRGGLGDSVVKRRLTARLQALLEPIRTRREALAVEPCYLQDVLRMLSRALSRKVKYSKGWDKARIKLAALHATMTNIRLDCTHKLTTMLSSNYSTIVIEDLSVRSMLQRSQRGLSRSIADMGFGEFRRQLAYKVEARGGELIVADRYFASSKECSNCHLLFKQLGQGQQTWTCQGCKKTHDRDENGSCNLHQVTSESKRPAVSPG